MNNLQRQRYLIEQNESEKTLYIRGFNNKIYNNGTLEKVYDFFNKNENIDMFDTVVINNNLIINIKYTESSEIDTLIELYGGINPVAMRFNIEDIHSDIKGYYDITLYRPSPKYAQVMNMKKNLNCLKVIGLDTTLNRETIRVRLRNIFHKYGPCYISIPNNLTDLDNGHGFVRYIYEADFLEALKHSWIDYKNKYPNNRVWSIKKFCHVSKLWIKHYSYNFYIDKLVANTTIYELIDILGLSGFCSESDILINKSQLTANLIVYSPKLTTILQNKLNLFNINDYNDVIITNRGRDIFGQKLSKYIIRIMINKRHFGGNVIRGYDHPRAKHYTTKSQKHINSNWRNNIHKGNWRK